MVTQYNRLLISYARKSIESGLRGVKFKPERIPTVLKKERCVFVTLTINGQLRGCIGLIKPVPLWKGVITAAYDSAFNDPRFNPLTIDEFKRVSIEISVLTKPVRISKQLIKKGDGVIISKGLRKALFLPQVWNELPDKESFIKQLLLKAGLRVNEQGVIYERFSVKIIKDND